MASLGTSGARSGIASRRGTSPSMPGTTNSLFLPPEAIKYRLVHEVHLMVQIGMDIGPHGEKRSAAESKCTNLRVKLSMQCSALIALNCELCCS